jgi:hypothetical protein
MKNTKSQPLFQDDRQTVCPICGKPAPFVERVNRRDLFRCADASCLMAAGFELVRWAPCQGGRS